MNNKLFTVQVNSPREKLGYNDKGALFVTGEPYPIWHGPCSGVPNPNKSKRLYGQLAFTTDKPYRARFLQDHTKFGRCLIINEGRELPSQTPNSKHNGKYVIDEVFVHHGETPLWRGSAGCITIPPDISDAFFSLFIPGEIVDIAITSMIPILV